MKSVAIIGAGITGLMAVFYVKHHGIRVLWLRGGGVKTNEIQGMLSTKDLQEDSGVQTNRHAYRCSERNCLTNSAMRSVLPPSWSWSNCSPDRSASSSASIWSRTRLTSESCLPFMCSISRAAMASASPAQQAQGTAISCPVFTTIQPQLPCQSYRV